MSAQFTSTLRQKKTAITRIDGGYYLHIGIQNQINKLLPLINSNVIIHINIDGIPLFNSYNIQLWPILIKFTNIENTPVMPIGVNFLRADRKQMQDKIEILEEAVSEQAATIKGMTKQQGQRQKVVKKFPIQSIIELSEMNMEINDTNRGLYIDAIRRHIMSGAILKNLKNILSNPVVMAYNVDGVQGKAALKGECLMQLI